MASVTFDKVTKKFGSYVAVDNLSLEIVDQEFLVLLGPSGCGKTTTLRMIAGLEDATSGEIRIGQDRVNGLLPKYRNVAMVFQSYALYPHMTVAENIGYPLRIRKVSREEQRQVIAEVAERVELGALLSRFPKELSGGQRQRVALARAIVRRPRVFLMDEPLSNLDAKLRTQMRAELKHLQHELRTTTVYVTHDQIEAMTISTRIAIMNKGLIEQVGTPKEIYNNPQSLFVAGFIGSPPMNLIEGELRDGRFTGKGVSIGGLGCNGTRAVFLGARPEDMRVVTADDPAANLLAQVYSVELVGDATLVTFRAGDQLITVKADKDYLGEFDQYVGVRIAPQRAFLFDAETGKRISEQ